MPSAAATSILAFGLTSLIAGASTLYDPHPSLQLLNLPLAALPALRANGLAAVAMGIYYPLAAYQNNIAFFKATIPMRVLTASIFWNQGWHAASLWEALGSVATTVALLWDSTREKIKEE
jgi:hypothetical protein